MVIYCRKKKSHYCKIIVTQQKDNSSLVIRTFAVIYYYRYYNNLRTRFTPRLPSKFMFPAAWRIVLQRVRAIAFPGFPGTRGSMAYRAFNLLSVAYHNGLVEFTERRDIVRSLVLFVAAVLDVHAPRRRTSIDASFDDRSQGLYDDERRQIKAQIVWSCLNLNLFTIAKLWRKKKRILCSRHYLCRVVVSR